MISCSHRTERRQNEIHKIVFAAGGCYDYCPIQVIDIDSSLLVKYHGVKHTNKLGFYRGKVSNVFWDSLKTKLTRIDYQQLDSTYEYKVDDLSTEIYIYYGNNQVKHVYGDESLLPSNVRTVYSWIFQSIK
jgi:hypothetical protein